MIYAFSFEGTNGVPTPFSVGLPLPPGTFWPEQNLQVVAADGKPLVSCVSPTSLWPDKSIRWCQLEGYSTLLDEQKLFLCEGRSGLFKKQDCAFEDAGKFVLKSKDLCIEVSTDSFLSVQQVTEQGVSPLTISPLFSLPEKHDCFTLQNSVAYTKTSSCNKPLYAALKQEYKTRLKNGNKTLNVMVEYKLDHPTNQLQITLAAHNPMPLVQKNGQWDLGNDNSINLVNFGLQLSLTNSDFLLADTHKPLAQKAPEFKKFSAWSMAVNNSGGENWLSKNHVDKNGHVPHTARGAIIVETQQQESQSRTELRPNFAFKLKDHSQAFVAKVDKLWEKFPLEVNASNDALSIDFCGTSELAHIELQPGEIKLHSFDIRLLAAPAENEVNLFPNKSCQLRPNTQAYTEANTIPWLSDHALSAPMADIIQLGLSGSRNFFAKREALDEFGWRNFGDIYADHEAVGHTGDDIFVSHYNNQYDPLQGFLKQWVMTGDAKWKTLADDLFEHIVNIDIYHTELDKLEYNGGLFWHTDHYVEAETATHRTYSKRQQTGVYEDHAGGGGPGSHHCYSSGLALYCQLTGSESAKKAVIQLGNWISYFFEGDGTLLGTLLQYRNKVIVRNPLTGRYPLDRGVANYVNVLLDSYELTADRTYMKRVSSIITHTFHFSDDIAHRNFDDIENTWYYIVFMQSVAKYLWVCETVYGIDHDYELIKKSFLHYVEWIANNEQPYLMNEDKLEYPNDTWTAQDLRKIMVLTVAKPYADTNELAKNIQLKIDSLTQYVEPKLASSSEKDSARILALVMQNAIADVGRYANDKKPPKEVTIEHRSSAYTFSSFAWRFIKNYSFTREIKHLFIRFPQLRFK